MSCILQMYNLYQDPQGERIGVGAHSSSAVTLPSSERQYETRLDTNGTVEMLRSQVRDLQAALSSLRPDDQSSTSNEGRPAARQQQSLHTDATLTTTAEE